MPVIRETHPLYPRNPGFLGAEVTSSPFLDGREVYILFSNQAAVTALVLKAHITLKRLVKLRSLDS